MKARFKWTLSRRLSSDKTSRQQSLDRTYLWSKKACLWPMVLWGAIGCGQGISSDQVIDQMVEQKSGPVVDENAESSSPDDLKPAHEIAHDEVFAEEVEPEIVFDITHQARELQKTVENYLKSGSKPEKSTSIKSAEVDVLKVLQSIHPRLIVGDLVKKASGHFILKKIGESVQREISQLLESQNLNYGVGLIQGRFWQDIFKLQNDREDIKVVFLVKLSANGKSKQGSYFDFDKKLLFIAPSADIRAIAYQIQRFEQHKSIDATISSAYFGKKREICLRVFSEFFSEIDASAAFSNYWKGIFESVDPYRWINSPSLEGGTSSSERTLSILQGNLWRRHFDFAPKMLASPKVAKHCPKTIQKAALKLHEKIVKEGEPLNTALTNWEEQVELFVHSVIAKDVPGLEQNSDILDQKFEELNAAFSDYLENYKEDYRSMTAAFADELAPSAVQGLCDRAMGFKQLVPEICP